MRMKRAFLSLAAMAAFVAPAAAQFAKTEDAIKYRQSAFFVMGQHFSRLGAMANGRTPFDAKVAADNAELVAALSHLPWNAFVPGSDKGQTSAKAEVWTDGAKFKESADKLQTELGKLAAAAKSGGPDALKAAFGSAARTCKACHDNFRSQ